MQLYAQPYNIDATGFYFESYEDYQAKTANHVDRFGMPVEEYEIQFIDGDQVPPSDPDQCNLDEWITLYQEYETLRDYELMAVKFLIDCGQSFADAMDNYHDVSIFDGTPTEYAEELVDDCYDLPEFAIRYFDYESFARDMVLCGDIAVIEGENYSRWVVTNACDF